MAKPFIKWAGGKSKLIPNIEPHIPEKVDFYYEPFLGGGAMLIHMLETHPEMKLAVANDINKALIITWTTVKYHVEELIAKLKSLEEQYLPLNNSDRNDFYAQIRRDYNQVRKDIKKGDELKIAAYFVFLNKVGYNGVYRENRKGEFNVPRGSAVMPKICDEENLREVSNLIQRVVFYNVEYYDINRIIMVGGRKKTLSSFVYIDPPYRDAHHMYTKEAFGDAEQIKLKLWCDCLDNYDTKFALSNSYSEDGFFQDLYQRYTIETVECARAINSDGKKRGKVKEILITN